jgi:hypothetical protein
MDDRNQPEEHRHTKHVTVKIDGPIRIVLEQAPPQTSSAPVTMRATIGPFVPKGSSTPGGTILMAHDVTKMDDSQKTTIHITEVDTADNKPAKIDGIIAWTTDNPTVATVVPSADGLSCDVISGVSPANDTPVNIIATADADLTAGVSTFQDTFPFLISPAVGRAAQFVATIDPPSPK